VNEPKHPQVDEVVRRVTADLVDRGKLIEAGWASLALLAFKDNTPENRAALRMAFFGGAQHLYGSIMSVMESGDEPTEKDMQRMALIDRELNEFAEEFKRQHMRPRV